MKMSILVYSQYQDFLEFRITRLNNLNSFRMTAKCNLNKAQQVQKQQYDSKHQCPKYKISDHVWYKNCRRNTRKGGKLESVWIGKRIIVEVLEKGTYKLDGLKRIFNATQHKPVIKEDVDTELPTKKTKLIENNNQEVIPLEMTLQVQSYIFHPPDVQWQRNICNASGGVLMFKNKSSPMDQVLNVKFTTFSQPTRINHIVGDGNCLFRALSFIVTGEEDQQSALVNIYVILWNYRGNRWKRP